MLTYKLKLKNNIDISEYLKQYSICFRIIYNNLKLIDNKLFNDELRVKFNFLDSWFIECAKVDAQTKFKQQSVINKKKSDQIQEIQSLIDNKTYKDKKHLYKLKNKLSYLNKTINKPIVFGSKILLQEITKLKQSNSLIEYQNKLNKFKQQRINSINSIGEMLRKSNRKYNFDLINSKLIFKPNVKIKIEIEFICSNKQQSILNKLQENIGNLSISIRLDNKFVYITFDEQKLFGYEFKQLDYYKEIKGITDKQIRKDIYIQYCNEQKERQLKDKIKDRYCAVDLNPEYIGLSIIDKRNFKIVHAEAVDLTGLNGKLRLSTKDLKQVQQNNKRRYEITVIWKHIFELCKHYKVSNFVIEDLNFKQKVVNTDNTSFNKKCNNLWYRTLTTQLINKYCNMNGIDLVKVNPAYSSFVGNMTYGYFDPVSSSIEICRRGMTKYEKGNKQFGSIDSINLQKAKIYLVNENVQFDINDLKELTIPKLFKMFSGLKYRNPLDSSGFTENYLSSNKSNVKCYNFNRFIYL